MARKGILSDLLQDEQFLFGAGLLSAGSMGQNVGQAALPTMINAARTANLFQNQQRMNDLRETISDSDMSGFTDIEKALISADPFKSLPLLQRKKKERKIIKGADGFNYFADNMERVLPDVVKEKKQPLVKIEGDKYESQYDKDRGAADAKIIQAINEKAETAQENIGRYDLVSVLSQNVNSGAFGEQLLSLAKAGKRLGINTDWITRTDANGNIGLRDGIANAETLEVLQVQFTLDKTQKTKGAISDTEFKTFTRTSPGLSMTPEGIQMLSTVNKKLAQRDIEVAELANQWEADYGRLRNKGETQYGKLSFQQFLNKWKEDNPVVTEEFLEDMRKMSNQGSDLYEDKQVYTISGVQYRKLKDGTVIRIGAL